MVAWVLEWHFAHLERPPLRWTQGAATTYTLSATAQMTPPPAPQVTAAQPGTALGDFVQQAQRQLGSLRLPSAVQATLSAPTLALAASDATLAAVRAAANSGGAAAGSGGASGGSTSANPPSSVFQTLFGWMGRRRALLEAAAVGGGDVAADANDARRSLLAAPAPNVTQRASRTSLAALAALVVPPSLLH